MAKSKIIKEIVNNEISLDVALSRLKIIVYDLNNEPLIKWINSELNGYDTDEELPKYRIINSDTIVYSGMCGHTKLTNVNTSIYFLPEKIANSIKDSYVRNDIATIEEKSKSEERIAQNLIALSDYFYANNGTQCSSIYLMFDKSQFQAIISRVKQIMIDIMLELEKEFGNLDDMDIETGDKDKKELKKFNQVLIQIIYNDDSIKIADKNRLKKVNIGSKINDK